MPHTLFISDLHLTAERPQINELFFAFLRDTAPAAEALYILGDLFEYWVGDDDTADAVNTSVSEALATLSRSGVRVYFLHGNRDFLVGQAFAVRSGVQLIADPTVIELYGTRTLLMHGDTLCTDDIEYQKARVQFRNPQMQAKLLQLPLAVRHQQARQLRAQSEANKAGKASEIMDVSLATVEQELRAHNYPRLIHGHTHRPARHEHRVDGHVCERWVLSDWYERGSYLYCDSTGCTARPL